MNRNSTNGLGDNALALDDCINFVLTRAQNIVFLNFRDQLAPFDVTPVQYAILKCLWDSGDQSPTQLAQALNLDASTITGILDRMERKHLLKRVHSRKDRRAIIVTIKPAGKELQPQIEKIIAETNGAILGVLSQEEQNQFRSYIDRITVRAENFASEV